MDTILRVNNLKKSFGDNDVLKGISFDILKNNVVGFVGNNGAGKSTTMKIILGLLKADTGEVEVMGEKVYYGDNKTNRYIGYLPDVPAFYPYMTPIEYLTMCAEITGVDRSQIRKRVSELVEFVGLNKNAKRRINGFSRGMKQRLGIAQAIVHKPELLICDEPTSALDPIGRAEIIDLLHNIKSETTVFFSTHILSDIERISDDVVMLNKGKIVLNGSIDELKHKNSMNQIRVVFKSGNDLQCITECLNNNLSAAYEQKNDRELLLKINNEKQNNSEDIESVILELLYSKKIFPQLIEGVEPSLEDIFVNLKSGV